MRNVSIVSSQNISETALEPVALINVDKASRQWIFTQGL